MKTLTHAEVRTLIRGTLQQYLPAYPKAAEAEVALFAIGYQEDKFLVREQYGHGPAHGLWQFEQGGGVRGVIAHPKTLAAAAAICHARGVEVDPHAVHEALLTDDVLACVFARLLLFSDSAPLPAIGEQDELWKLYLRTWRPGVPRPDDWPESYRLALEVMRP